MIFAPIRKHFARFVEAKPLGDTVALALSKIGLSKERVNQWLGSCRCAHRQEKLNQLSLWAARVLAGNVANAETHLNQIIGNGITQTK